VVLKENSTLVVLRFINGFKGKIQEVGNLVIKICRIVADIIDICVSRGLILVGSGRIVNAYRILIDKCEG
jgi:hypothetical protein